MILKGANDNGPAQRTTGLDERIGSLFQPDTLLSEDYAANFRRKLPLEAEDEIGSKPASLKALLVNACGPRHGKGAPEISVLIISMLLHRAGTGQAPRLLFVSRAGKAGKSCALTVPVVPAWQPADSVCWLREVSITRQLEAVRPCAHWPVACMRRVEPGAVVAGVSRV